MRSMHLDTRIAALDGLRGVLALVVVVAHVAHAFGSDSGREPARVAVLCFFAMSGFVLARSYDRRPLAFMARRVVRLWPLYAVSIMAGHLLVGTPTQAGELLWWPALPSAPPEADPPAWTLYMEAWATPILPVMFWIAVRSRALSMLAAVSAFALVFVDVRLYFVAVFGAGVAAAQFAIPWPRRIPRVALWLGDVSYSLYLTHWVVMFGFVRVLGAWGSIASLPAVFGVAWLCWRWIEKPSIALSRRVGGVKRNSCEVRPEPIFSSVTN